MAHSTPNDECYAIPQHHLQKLNLERSSIMDKPPYHCAPHLNSLSINNLQHQQNLTMLLPYVSSIPLSNKKSKSMDMGLYQVKVQTCQGNFFIYWGPSKTNKAGCLTKHYPPSHNTATRHEHLHKSNHGLRFVPLQGLINCALVLTSFDLSHKPRGPKFNRQEQVDSLSDYLTLLLKET